MNAVEIDVSGNMSMITLLCPFGEVVILLFEVRHIISDLSDLSEQLKAIDGETRVLMDHAGQYYELVTKVLHEIGLFVSSVNPLLIKEDGDNSFRKIKTDKADTQKIARYALDYWQNCTIILLWALFAIIKDSQSSVSICIQAENINIQQYDCIVGTNISRHSQVR